MAVFGEICVKPERIDRLPPTTPGKL